MSDVDPLLCETQEGLTILRLNQADRMNPLNGEAKAKLAQEIPKFFRDPLARCLIITGTAKAFCAGGDIRTMVGDQSAAAVRERLATSHENWARHLLLGEKPVIMAVNGPAVGAGFALAMLGDIIIASESAYFVGGFSAVGAAADLGLGATLPRAVGMPRAKEILFTNRKVSAEEALSIGMVTSVVSDEGLLQAAIDLGEKLANGPTVGIGLTKMLLNTGYEESITTFFNTESIAQTVAFSTADRVEGVTAFLERRKPKFNGR